MMFQRAALVLRLQILDKIGSLLLGAAEKSVHTRAQPSLIKCEQTFRRHQVLQPESGRWLLSAAALRPPRPPGAALLRADPLPL